jgi:hypothetical protein
MDALFGALIGANIGVIIGVVWEEEELLADIRSQFDNGGWRSLLTEARTIGFKRFALKVWGYNKIKPGLRLLVLSLTLEIAVSIGLEVRDAAFKTAASTSIAKLQIDDNKQQRRNLTNSQQAEIAQKLRRWAQVYPGTIPSITVPPYASESHWLLMRDDVIQRLMQMAFVIPASKLAESNSLASDISTALALANWDVDPINPPPNVFGDLTSKSFFGVRILSSSNPRAMNVATDLKSALATTGISSTVSFSGPGCDLSEAPFFNEFWRAQRGTPWCSLVLVIVGDHP